MLGTVVTFKEAPIRRGELVPNILLQRGGLRSNFVKEMSDNPKLFGDNVFIGHRRL
jgi:hypothetical protein